ncbi:MAG: zinc-dependent metalloprotease, partial [Acidobacteria bacterium]|nr:zinc-dependent metalloprotease [Acidobacteriota bacterium]
GLLFLSDEDARPAGAAHPLANLWDNGEDPLAALEQTLEVRRRALSRFGAANLAEGQPFAQLEEVLAPLYFHHRYQLEATAKLLGGFDYTYAHRGEEEGTLRPTSASSQRQALIVLLETLSPSMLDLPEDVLLQLLPRPLGYKATPELFRGDAAPGFDPLAAAATAARLTLEALLQPQRAERLIDFHRRDSALPGFEEVLEAVVAEAFPLPPVVSRPGRREEPRRAEVRRAVQGTVVASLVDLASRPDASFAVRSRAEGTLRNLERRLSRPIQEAPPDDAQTSHFEALAAQIRRFLGRPWEGETRPRAALEAPPGSPIGMAPAIPSLAGCSGG